MNKIISFVFWPAVAGLIFAVALMQVPAIAVHVPALRSFYNQPQQEVRPSKLSFSNAIKRAAPAVVSINSQQVVQRFIEEYSSLFGPSYRPDIGVSNSLGSGVVISPDGYIITSYHLLFNAETGFPPVDNTITLSDGRSFEARMVKLDEENDLALLKVDAENLPSINPAEIEALEVGDVVLAIGNPRNIGQSVSFGIVSAFVRKGDSYVIQTDAAINPGNSGGALIDQEGNLIGINSTIISDSGGSEGIGFATPAQKAFALMQNYIDGGPSGYLGISVHIEEETFSFVIDEVRRQGEDPVRGILVTKVAINGPADRAGIRPNDMLTAVNDTKITSIEQAMGAFNFIGANSPGDVIHVEVFRNGDFHAIPVVLGVGEPNLTLDLRFPEEIGSPPSSSIIN
jgi:S1-C subfamily serine protease